MAIADKQKNRFASFVVRRDGYIMANFHKTIADNVQRLYDGKIKKLAIFLPPQHGKSTLSSVFSPAWFLGKNPALNIAVCGYGVTLTRDFCRKTLQLMESDDYKNTFGDILGKVKQSSFFETKQGGSYTAVGIGGALTGKRVDIGIIDDPYKDRISAVSDVQRKRVEDWYDDVFTSRLNNSSKVIMLFTRWHHDDLAEHAKVLSSNDWNVLEYPAIKEDEGKEYDKREIGAALFPQMHSKEKLQEIREKNPRTFESLYQQRPSVKGGDIIEGESFEVMDYSQFHSITRGKTRLYYMDTAYTEKKYNDPTAILTCVQIGKKLYVQDVTAKHIRSSELPKFTQDYTRDNNYTNQSLVKIEPKASGQTVIQLLKDQQQLNVRKFTFPKRSGLNQSSDKVQKVAYVENYIAGGNVVLCRGAWNDSFINECEQFPNGKHDDRVDVLAMACADAIAKKTFKYI